MPASFYARYVPPAQKSALDSQDGADINPRPTKRNKTAKVSAAIVVKPLHSTTNHERSSPPILAAARNKISKSEKPQPEDYTGSEDTENVYKKHKSIRTKYETASRVSQLAIEKAEDDKGDYFSPLDETRLEKVQPVGIQPLPQPKQQAPKLEQAISTLPRWLMEPIHAERTASFESLNLSLDIVRRLSKSGFKTAFAIQTTVIPMLLPGPEEHQGDVCVSAATGFGKTFAYTLPIIESLKDRSTSRLAAVIVVPTRELVAQVQEVFRVTGSSLRVGTAVGNKSLKDERKTLINVEKIRDPEAYHDLLKHKKNGSASWSSINSSDEEFYAELPKQDDVVKRSSKIDVLICTPGRLVDHIRSTKGFTLEYLQWLIVDEADRLLDQSFQQWIDIVIPKLEKDPVVDVISYGRVHGAAGTARQGVRKVVLSATMTRDYSKLLALNLKNPVLITARNFESMHMNTALNVQDELATVLTSIPEHLKEVAVAVKDAAEKPLYLVQLIEESIVISHIVDEHSTTNGTSRKQSSSLSRVKRNSSSNVSNTSDSDFISSASDSSISDSSDEGHSTTDDASDTDSSDSLPVLASPTLSETIRNESRPQNYGFLVFTNTNESALRLRRLLVILRPKWSSRLLLLTKSSGTSIGRKTLSAFRQKKADIIIATDRASRGLDLKHLAHVINYDMPKSLTTYIHRVGRTARAGQVGVASTLVCYHEARWFWSEIGKTTAIGRRDNVKREDTHPVLTEKDRLSYEQALATLGNEVKGHVNSAAR